jgi:hypothetical protein
MLFSEPYIGNSLLMEKHRAVYALYKQMTNDLSDERPNCKEILDRSDSWALSEDEFEFEQSFKSYSKINNSVSNELSLFSIIETKFRKYIFKNFFKLYYHALPWVESLEDMMNIMGNDTKCTDLSSHISEINANDDEIFEIYTDPNIKNIIKSLSTVKSKIINQIEDEFSLDKIVKVSLNLADNNVSSKELDELKKKSDVITEKSKIQQSLSEAYRQFTFAKIGLIDRNPNHFLLQRQRLLVLCNYHVLNIASFGINKCIETVVVSLVNFDDYDMNRMAIAIISMLAHKLSIEEKSILCSNESFNNRLIDIVMIRYIYSSENDIILTLIMKIFIDLNGYQIIESILRKSKQEQNEHLISICEKLMKSIENFERFSERNQNEFQEKAEGYLQMIKEETILMETLNTISDDLEDAIKILNRLYIYLEINCDPRNDLIELLISIMRKFSDNINVILLTCASLNMLTKDEFVEKIDENLIEKIIETTLSAMDLHKDNLDLYKSGFAVIVNKITLEKITFDKYKCIEIALNSLTKFSDNTIVETAIAICSGLSSILTLKEKAIQFSKSSYMNALIGIVKRNSDSLRLYDFVIEHTMNFLLNTTDRSPDVCQLFLKYGGLDAYLFILKVIYELIFEIILTKNSNIFF